MGVKHLLHLRNHWITILHAFNNTRSQKKPIALFLIFLVILLGCLHDLHCVQSGVKNLKNGATIQYYKYQN